MLYLSHQKKNLEQYVLKNVLDRRSVIWKPIDHADRLENFQRLDEEDLSNITCGSYQLRLSFCYIQQHIKWEVDIFVHRKDPGLIQVKLQSRHVSSRKYSLCIQFNETQIMRPTANAEQERELQWCVLMWQLYCGSLVFLGMHRGSVHMVSRTEVTHFKMLQSLTIPTLMTVCVRNNCVKFLLRALFSIDIKVWYKVNTNKL